MSVSTTSRIDDSIDDTEQNFELPTHELRNLLSTPPIDRDRLLAQCLNNLDFSQMLLNEFEKSSQSRLEAFKAALTDRDYAAIACKAHAFKGVAGILAASVLMQTCSELETAATDADLNLTHALIQQLQFEMQRTIDFIPILGALT